MAKDYRKKFPTPRNKKSGGASKQLSLVFLSFLCGYLSSSIVDLNSLSTWVHTTMLAKGKNTAQTQQVAQQAPLPKPKFEFYTLLAKDHTSNPAAVVALDNSHLTPVVSAPQTLASNVAAPTAPTVPHEKVASLPVAHAAVPTTPVGPPVVAAIPASSPAAVAAKNSYLVQIASFKSRQEAERMKAQLTLKGFNVNIALINQQQMNWYRVILGPFPSRLHAEKAQVAVAHSEHIIGMIRKMDA